jgi:L-aspartate oxidase
MRYDDVLSVDVVVVGAGVAGLSATLGVDGARVVLVTKTPLGGGGSSIWAQGGVAAAIARGDDPHRHAADTVAVGAGLNDPAAVDILTREGPGRVRRLLELGARFDRTATGDLALGREAGHSVRRILHADGDRTGAELIRTLTEAVRRAAHVDVDEGAFAVDLALDGDRVAGVVVRRGNGALVLYRTRAVVLATGGIGRVYVRTTNPPEVTGDGLAMAARAGARLADLEFVQFHPTALASGRDPMPLLTEALRGEGAALVDDEGRRFMVGVHPDAELAPRDVVARATWEMLAAGRKVFLDATGAVGASFPDRFPTVYAECLEEGIDPRVDPVPVSPAAHYHMGGIVTDRHGRTSLPGLWAAGEAACTGVHGANRLASNSLLEGLVFGARVAAGIGHGGGIRNDRTALWVPSSGGPAPDHGDVETLRRVMWERVGLVRDEEGLSDALERLDDLQARIGDGEGEGRNLALVARLVTTSALARRESRGAHYRRDHPAPGDFVSRVTWTGLQLDDRMAVVA